jgi:hypothetical protein
MRKSAVQLKSKNELINEVPCAGKNSHLFKKIFNKNKTNITINMNDHASTVDEGK